MGGKRRKKATLACFVQALEGQRVVVELRYDSIVRGQLLGADDQLNLQLGDATYQPLQGPKREMPYVYLKGRHVRFVHLPGNLDPAAAIEQHRRRVATAVKAHAAEQVLAAQQPGARLQKGTQLDFGRPQQAQQQQQPQQQPQQAQQQAQQQPQQPQQAQRQPQPQQQPQQRQPGSGAARPTDMDTD